MSDESLQPIQTILHFSQRCTDERRYEKFRRHVNNLVGQSLLDSNRAKQLSHISRAVDLNNITPNTAVEIQRLEPEPPNILLSELQPEEWLLLEELLNNFS